MEHGLPLFHPKGGDEVDAWKESMASLCREIDISRKSAIKSRVELRDRAKEPWGRIELSSTGRV
jgi:hypothetical protein